MKKIIIFFISGLFLAGATLFLYPPLRVYVPFYWQLRTSAILLLRNPMCSYSNASRNLSLVVCPYTKIGMFDTKSQLLTKDSDNFEQWETPKGIFWTPPGLKKIALVFCLAEMDCNVYGIPEQKGVHSGDIVLDCGAHIGTFTREALSAGAKLVVAIEPTPENVVCLQRSFAKEIHEGRVIVYGKGVWDRDEVLTFYASEQTNYNSILEINEMKEFEVKMPVTTIDHIVSELNLPRVDFIKMDIEGAEQQAINGGRETISKFKPRMAVATEHTTDFLDNALKVSDIVTSINNGYKRECNECIIMKGFVTPLTVLFY